LAPLSIAMLSFSSPTYLLAVTATQLLIHSATALPGRTQARQTEEGIVYVPPFPCNTTIKTFTGSLSAKPTKETVYVQPFPSNTTIKTFPGRFPANQTEGEIECVHSFSSNTTSKTIPSRLPANQTEEEIVYVQTSPSNTTTKIFSGRLEARQTEGEIVCVQPFPSNTTLATYLTNFVLDYSSQICSMLGQGQQGTLAQEEQGYAFYSASMVVRDQNTCIDAFKQIANVCISQGMFYGGQIVEAGQLYNLTNVVFPSDPLGNVTAPSVPPLGPLPPMPTDCPSAFLNDTTATATATAGQAKFTQQFNRMTDTEMFTPQTQWRFFTDAQTDVDAWEVDFTGGMAPQVTTSPTVVSFEMQEGVLPSK
jgi:hypothetical protein